MDYTVKFLDEKLHQSLSFDADIKFPDFSEYTKKIWILKEYKKANGELDLVGADPDKPFSRAHSSYSIEKSFEGGVLSVEIIENIKFSDNFDYFSRSETEQETGDDELDQILASIKKEELPANTIFSIMFGSKKDIGNDFDVNLNDELKTTIREMFGISDKIQFGDFKHQQGCSYIKDKCECNCRCSDSE